MNLTTWLLLGVGAFLLYSAYKGNNPLASLAKAFGISHTSADKVAGGGSGGGSGGSW